MKRRNALGLVAALALVACAEHERVTQPHEQYPQVAENPTLNAGEATIVVSDLAPKEGNIVTVAGVLPMSDSLTVGSFVARLNYNPDKLHYLGESDDGDMMRVVNAEKGLLTVAAASSNGPKDGRLFTFRFRADDPTGVSSLVLSMSELNDTKYVSRLSSIHVASSPHQDKTLAPKRVNTQ